MLLDGSIELFSNMLEADENIAVRACDWCGQPFYQGRRNHRFCCVEHGRKFHMAEPSSSAGAIPGNQRHVVRGRGR